MSRVPRPVRQAIDAPGIGQARRAAELAVTPRTRVDLLRLEDARLGIERLLAYHSSELNLLRQALADVEESLPSVLNAISSIGGASRAVRREFDSFSARLDPLEAVVEQVGSLNERIERLELAGSDEFEQLRTQVEALRQELATSQHDVDVLRGDTTASQQIQSAELDTLRDELAQGDLRVLGEIRPHIETLAWLMNRVEFLRFEVLNELRYGQRQSATSESEAQVINKEALDASPLKVNLGAGHVPMDGYVNVDMRELPGIDVVAVVDDLPFEPGTVDEIFSSHTLEHFPQETLRRTLLPYWASLLKPGGALVAVAPDVDAMSRDYVSGAMPFADFREVLYGGQEYEGDSHFTGFTPDSFSDMLREAGFGDVVVVARDRRNGKCKEFEIVAQKAS